MTLPAFKRSPSCPKCGSDSIAFEFEAAKPPTEGETKESGGCGWSGTLHQGEHIHLTCGRCDYGKARPWVMAVAESPRIIGFRPRASVPTDSTGVA